MKPSIPLSSVWISLSIMGSLLVAFVGGVGPHDYWWHLAMGRRFSQSGHIPDTNLFLYTRPLDEPFFNQPWLGQWLMYQMHEWGGPIIGLIFLSLSCLIFALILLKTFKDVKLDPRLASVITFLALTVCKPIFSVRTRMFAILPMLLITHLLFKYQRGKSTAKSLFWIPPLIVFWANTHGSFVVGVMMTWLLFADRLLLTFGVGVREELETRASLKHVTLLAIASTLAGCVHPYGIKVYTYVLELAIFSNVATTVTEWRPPSIQEGIGVFVLILVLLCLALLFRFRKALSIFTVLMCALGIYLGVSAQRSLLFFGIILPFALAPFLGELVPKKEEERATTVESFINGTLILGLTVMLFLSFPLFRPQTLIDFFPPTRRGAPGAGVFSDGNISPTIVARSKRVFHAQGIGGQIEWIFDGPAAFVDQRMEYIPQSVWDEYYVVSKAKKGWSKVLEKYEIDTLILLKKEHANLVKALLDSKQYYHDHAQDEGPYVVFRSFDRFENPLK